MVSLARRLLRVARLVCAYARVNVQTAAEYRASFFSQIVGMALNDGIWLAFWWLYFTQFPVLGSWERQDVVVLWCVVATAFGIATGVFGNCVSLAGMIVKGELDFYLVLPCDPLAHALVSRMSTSAWGDVAFGVGVFLLFGRPDAGRLALFAASVALATALLVSFFVLVNCLAFFIGSSQSLSDQLVNVMIHFASYPTSVFRGATRILLFTLIPAGFVSSTPVYVIRRFSLPFFAALVLATTLLAGAAVATFRAGLRRYESGNLFTARM